MQLAVPTDIVLRHRRVILMFLVDLLKRDFT